MRNDDAELDALFVRYRNAFADREAGANFMPELWQKIEARHSLWFAFQQTARTAMTACAAVCLLLFVLTFVVARHNPDPGTYADALVAEHTAETTYYTEGIRNSAEMLGTQQPLQR
jgi:hypothetical protein